MQEVTDSLKRTIRFHLLIMFYPSVPPVAHLNLVRCSLSGIDMTLSVIWLQFTST
jgi:hypothetical protein